MKKSKILYEALIGSNPKKERVSHLNDNAPSEMMLHIANVYFHWIGNFSLGLNMDLYPDQHVSFTPSLS